jgi:hypothetical protein
LRYRCHWLEIEIHRDRMVLHAPGGWAGPPQIRVRDRTFPFGPGQRLELRRQADGGGWEAGWT